MTAERLQKLISAAGIASRRAAERLIAEGRVTVDGEVVRTPGVRADPEAADIRVDGARLRAVHRPRRYTVLNKPVGHLTTRSDPSRRPTVMDLLPLSLRSLAPVGRLDAASSGLVLFTDDGALAQRVTHPKYRLPKTYLATVRGLPEEEVLARAVRGLRVDGEFLRLDRAEVLARFPHRAAARRRSRLKITLRGGRNREIRRVFGVLGHPVVELHRTRIGPLTDRGLRPGRWRRLTPAEVEELREAIRLASGEKKPVSGEEKPVSGEKAPVSGERSPAEAERAADAPPAGAGGAPPAETETAVAPEPPPFVVAIDGPAGSGKTSVARAVAERFDLGYFNTGASVRAVALGAMRDGVPLDEGPPLCPFAYRVVLDPEGRVFLDGEEVSTAVRAPEVSRGASAVAVHPELREVLVSRWRSAAGGGGVVEGRDIGTVVFPEAPVKIFLEARPEVRARRRSSDEGDRDVRVVEAELSDRDHTDSGRQVAPLRRAPDAHTVDTSELTLAQTVDQVAALVTAARQAHGDRSSRAGPRLASKIP